MSEDLGISISMLQEMLSYNPEDGSIMWVKSPARNIYAGEPAGCVKATRRDKNGKPVSYSYIRFDGQSIPSARIAWALAYGEWPHGRIVFQDKDPLNLRLSNLAISNSLVGHAVKKSRTDSEYYREHRQAFATDYRDKHLQKKFGITLLDYSRLFLQQGGKCAICGGTDAGTRNGTPKSLAVDHDHETGKVRGLLCEACNTGIGKLKDDPNVLRAAIRYLEEARIGADQTGRADAVQTDQQDLAQEEVNGN